MEKTLERLIRMHELNSFAMEVMEFDYDLYKKIEHLFTARKKEINNDKN